MTKANSQISLSCLNQILSQSLLVAFLSTIGLVTGLTPDLSIHSPHLLFNSSALAESISDDEVRRFAQAAYTIERKRLSLVQGMARQNRQVPNIPCAALEDNSPGEVRNFCEFSRQTIEANQLTVGRFQQIRSAMQSDPSVRQKVDAELRRLQSGI